MLAQQQPALTVERDHLGASSTAIAERPPHAPSRCQLLVFIERKSYREVPTATSLRVH
jgi:hypothetical protein